MASPRYRPRSLDLFRRQSPSLPPTIPPTATRANPTPGKPVSTADSNPAPTPISAPILASRIGSQISVELAAAGAKVMVNYHSHSDEADQVVAQIKAAGGAAMTVQADVADTASVAAMFKQMDDAWSGVDILINNAEIDGERMITWDADPVKWKKVIDTNLGGAFFCSRETNQRMTSAARGIILKISSAHQEIDWSGYSAYTASKAAIAMMMKTMVQEAAPHGVRVLSIAPGAIKTPINKPVWSDPQKMADLNSKIPLNRIGQPNEIASMVVVLVSDVASYITGETVFIDGCMTDYPSFADGG